MVALYRPLEPKITHQDLNEKYRMLSVYNLPLGDFMKIFSNCRVDDFFVYWFDDQCYYLTKSTKPLPLFDINQYFKGFGRAISSVELALDSGFTIDSNLTDEIFCQTPIEYDMQELIKEIRLLTDLGVRNEVRLPALDLRQHQHWITEELEV